jgi:hypothetical protein
MSRFILESQYPAKKGSYQQQQVEKKGLRQST